MFAYRMPRGRPPPYLFLGRAPPLLRLLAVALLVVPLWQSLAAKRDFAGSLMDLKAQLQPVPDGVVFSPTTQQQQQQGEIA